ncbi:helix-turn-helix transcriptional regulator [Actinopolymorpha sp. B11F2]|uniref:helix-turn-helix domain-containing protein n=1 Tax=Actinopolymorpha sp. B11F2 TaxID=3160862 RepID=UPI0032E4AA9A
MPKRPREAIPNATLYNLRDARGMTQLEVAHALNELAAKHDKAIHIDNVTVSRWERGVIERPSPLYRRLLAELFDVSLDELGFTRPASVATPHVAGNAVGIGALVIDQSPMSVEPRVQADQDQWRATRAFLNRHRAELGRVAARLYDPDQRLDNTGLLTRSGWLPDYPVSLTSIELDLLDDAPGPTVTGTATEARGVRPLATVASRYERYSHGIRDLAHPVLFENRLSYRLLGAGLTSTTPRMSFSHTTYFEGIDIHEALGHELATVVDRSSDDEVSRRTPSWRGLPLRRLIGDPCDFTRRSSLVSLSTLTIRDDGKEPSFVLHDRSAARVAIAGGTLHVMPAGTFQPSSILPGAQAEDFDLWRNVMREYSEEFLGNREHGGDGAPVDYGSQPFASLDAGVRDGRAQIYCLGLGLDALTLNAEILTVAVFDADLYDDLFAEMVASNDEGTIVTVDGTMAPTNAIPFDRFTVPRLIEHTAMAPAARGCLQLAWDHRKALFGE